VSLLPLEELFGPDHFAGGKLLEYLMTYATSPHQILLLLDQCRSSKSCALLKLRRVLAAGRSRQASEPTALLSREADRKVDVLLPASATKAYDCRWQQHSLSLSQTAFSNLGEKILVAGGIFIGVRET
jgi:hypothetical protein